MSDSIQYYQSSDYKELQARENLGYVKPGEKVIVLAQKKQENTKDNNSSQLEKTADNRPNYLKWWNFLIK